MILIWESLDDALHQILLSKGIFADNDDLQNLWQDGVLVYLVGEAFEHAHSNNVLSNSDSQFISFDFSHFLILLGAEMLQPDPESVHFAHILKDKVDGIVDITVLWTFIL